MFYSENYNVTSVCDVWPGCLQEVVQLVSQSRHHLRHVCEEPHHWSSVRSLTVGRFVCGQRLDTLHRDRHRWTRELSTLLDRGGLKWVSAVLFRLVVGQWATVKLIFLRVLIDGLVWARMFLSGIFFNI